MANNKLRGPKPISGDPEVKMPKFNFSDYDGSGRTVYHNNDEYIDFVTYNGALYVCLVPTIAPTTSAPSEGFLKLVDKGSVGPKGAPGRDGESAVAPRIGANFINDQLAVTVNDRTVAVSPSLTGPSWKPVREGDHLTWELTDDRESPDDINLMDLRPVDKCPLLLRVDSDNTKRSDEVSGPARFIQWKYEGDKYWTNLISISELMNLALCGICFWYDKHDQEWHYGHKEVIRADYASDKNGRKIISRVKLGDVLFDAGVLPINDYGVEIELINQRLNELEDGIVKSISLNGSAKITPDNNGNVDLPIDLSDYAKKNWVDANFQPIGDYVEGIRVNGGRVNRPENGIVNLEIEEGGSGDDSDCVKSVEIDGDKKYPVNGNVSFNLGDKYNLFDLNYRNGHLYKVVNGNETDLGEFGPSGEPTEGDGVGVDNIEFRINSSTGKLEFRMSVDGEWQSWNPIDLPAGSGGEGDGVGVDNIEFRINSDNELEFRMSVDGVWKSWNVINLPSGTSGEGDGVGIDDIKFELQDGQLKYQVSIDGVWEEDWHLIPLPGGTTGGEHVDLQITSAGMLQIRYDGGEWQDVGMVNTDSDLSNAFINVSIRNNKLIFVRKNGTTEEIDIPSGGSEGSVVSVRQILLSGTHIATITVDGTDYKIYAPNGGGGDDDPGSGSTVIADLTNEIDPVPVNDENVVHTVMTFNTTGRMWKDGVELAIDSITTSYSKSGVTVTINGANCTIVVDENVVLDSTQEIMFALTAGSITRYVAYKLVPIRAEAGSTYGVVVDPTAIVIDKNGNYSVNKITVNTYWLRNGELKPLAGWDSVDDISSWSVWYYVDDAQSGVRYTQNSNLDLDFIRTINRQIRFELIFKVAGNSTTIDIETIPIIRDGSDGQNGQDGDTVTILSQVRYYKASDQSTGIVAPNSSLDPTLPENGSWLTSSNSIVLDATNAYLWMFERIIYSNDRIWQSDPVVIRFFNDQVEVDYDTLAAEVESRISDDLNAAKQRITNAENRLNNLDDEIDGITTTTDDLTGRVTAVEARAVYDDDDIKALAEVVIDAKKASIVAEADANTDGKINVVNQTLNALDGRVTSTADSLDEVSGELNTVKADLNAAEANIELAATKSELNGAISDARTEWSAADAAITSTVYTKDQTDTMMSAIQQKADKISILVGEDGDVKADVIVDAINGGEVTIEANKINLLGETIATAIEAAEISADQIHGGTIDANCIDANSLHVDVANVDGLLEAGQIKTELINADEIHATVAEFEYLKVDGQPISASNSLNISFGLSSLPEDPDPNTLYFLY